ncbi:hypothetical protein AEGHOMDF_4487 [Methylobacterium soli]|nr:hypothetical protein AEGHOMDF_4487 [Methylobacterium soli]
MATNKRRSIDLYSFFIEFHRSLCDLKTFNPDLILLAPSLTGRKLLLTWHDLEGENSWNAD